MRVEIHGAQPAWPMVFASSLMPRAGRRFRAVHSGALCIDTTTVFGLRDAMSPRKNFSNRIVEAEANPASSRRVKRLR
jgi:hypothetical protein